MHVSPVEPLTGSEVERFEIFALNVKIPHETHEVTAKSKSIR